MLDAEFFRRWRTAAAAAVDRAADQLTAVGSPVGDAGRGGDVRRGVQAGPAAPPRRRRNPGAAASALPTAAPVEACDE